ncbi:MAG: hypothetical protein DHS20C11_33270 [Lysobacteraceae bacterium]|nr:MAG: hypothetical protein DHS20C11_33270 [Xanthomonadaceae bacterium]
MPSAGNPSDPVYAEIEGRNTADYLLRTAQQHHVQVSAMADRKANIIITVCSIVVTLVIGRSHEPAFAVPITILGVFTLIALLLAIIAVLPSYAPPKIRGEGRLPKNFNLLFFGHFASLDMARYELEMARVLAKDANVYRALVKDLYEIGYYLAHRKYRFLRWSYFFFLGGFMAAGISQLFFYL